MLTLWLSFYYLYPLAADVWWAFPSIVTLLIIGVIEIYMEVALVIATVVWLGEKL